MAPACDVIAGDLLTGAQEAEQLLRELKGQRVRILWDLENPKYALSACPWHCLSTFSP